MPREVVAHTCIKMAVEMDNRHRTISTVDRSQERESDGVITAEGDHSGEGLSEQRRALLLGIRLGCSREDAIMALFDLVESIGVVVPVVERLSLGRFFS